MGHLYRDTKPIPTMESLPTTPDYKLSGGPVPAAHAEEYQALRALIKKHSDVYDVLGLYRREDGMWVYFIQTPLDWVSPKYVIGTTDAQNENFRANVRCDAEWTARAEWSRIELNKGIIHPPA